MTNTKRSRLLASAASAFRHGRNRTGWRKMEEAINGDEGKINLTVSPEELLLLINALEIINPDSDKAITMRDNLLNHLYSKEID